MPRVPRALLALAVTAAALAGAGAAAGAAQANACPGGVVCVYDAVGWGGVPRTYDCVPITNRSLGTFSRKVSSVINNCRLRVILSDFDPIQPTGLTPRNTTIFAGEWIYTLGGARRLDNAARVITIR